MDNFKSVALASVVSLVSACGGGGGSSSGGPSSAGLGAGGSDSGSTELILEYASEPLQPRLFNLGTANSDFENHFSPGETLNITWNMELYYSDNSSIGLGEQHLYDASVYLSFDDNLQEALDLKLFDIECSIPGTSTHSCSNFGSFQCVYALDNANTISCLSIPLDKEVAITEPTVDTTDFLDSIPKSVSMILKACLREAPSTCTEETLPVQFN
ncbi:MAG: hypothetical protein JKX76_15505 [Colwellia sp.]|nr:hypothetical protein [Colwellia sp.]